MIITIKVKADISMGFSARSDTLDSDMIQELQEHLEGLRWFNKVESISTCKPVSIRQRKKPLKIGKHNISEKELRDRIINHIPSKTFHQIVKKVEHDLDKEKK